MQLLVASGKKLIKWPLLSWLLEFHKSLLIAGTHFHVAS